MNSAQQGNLSEKDETTTDEFNVVFKGEALKNLRDLAVHLGIASNKLGDVLIKGIHIMNLARNKRLIIEDNKSKSEINLKQL